MPLEVGAHCAVVRSGSASGADPDLHFPGLHLPANSRLAPGEVPSEILPAVFLDRDGVIVRDVHYLRRAAQIELLPGIASLSRLQLRFRLIVATNQSGIARGLFSEDDLLSIHSELVVHLENAGVIIDAFYYCPHLDSAEIGPYHCDCLCRKPGAGMLVQAATDWHIPLRSSYLIGDSLRDVEAGRAAGLAGSILLGASDGGAAPGLRAHNLEQAIERILEMQADA